MSPKVTTTVTAEVKLSPVLRRKVLIELKTFAGLQLQMKVLQAAMQSKKDRVLTLFEDAGEFRALTQGIALDGFKTKYVSGFHTDKKRYTEALIEMGVTAEMLTEAKEKALKPSKPYIHITSPGESEEERED